MKKLLILLCFGQLSASAAISQLNALSWCKADGSNQTAQMQTAVNVAVQTGNCLVVPAGIVYTYDSLTNTATLCIEDYTVPGRKIMGNALELRSQPGSTNSFPNLWLGGPLSVTNAFIDIRTTGASTSSADNATAIQAAIDAAPAGSTVYIPQGTWNSGVLVANKDIRLAGPPDAIIKLLSTTDEALLYADTTNFITITVEGLTLDGNWQNRDAFRTNIVNKASIISTRDENITLRVHNTTFTNSQRSAVTIAGPAWITDSRFLNIKTNSGDGNGVPGNTFAIYAQPSGYNTNLHLQVTGCEFVSTTGTNLSLAFLSARGIWVSEQANNVDTTLNTNRYTLTAIGNRFLGLGGWFHSTEGGAIEIYNGANSPIIANNLIEYYAHCGIQIQRTGNAVVTGNVIKWGYNNYDGLGGIYQGNSKAILFEPEAREGSYPFTGLRSGELHRGAIIQGNYILDHQQNGVYAKGRAVQIKNNIFDGRVQTFGSSPPSVISIQGDNIEVDGNTFINIPNYAVACTGAYTNIWVRNNRGLNYDGSVTNTSGYFVFQHARDVMFENNYAYFSTNSAATFLYIDKATNFVSKANRVDLNSTNSVALGLADADTVPQVTQKDDSWAPDMLRRAWSGLTYDTVMNLDTGSNTLAGAARRVQTIDSGGAFAAYPWNYLGTGDAGRLVIVPDTTAAGLNITLHPTDTGWQDFRINIDGMNQFYIARTSSRILGSDPIPFVVDSLNSSSLIRIESDNGTDRGLFGWSGGNPGIAIIDSTGTQFNFHIKDDGITTVRSNLVVNGTGKFLEDDDILVLQNLTTNEPNYIAFRNYGGAANRGTAGYSVSAEPTVFAFNNNFLGGFRFSDTTGATFNGSLYAPTVTSTNGFYVGATAGIDATYTNLISGVITQRVTVTKGIITGLETLP